MLSKIIFVALFMIGLTAQAEVLLAPNAFKSGFVKIHDKQELWVEHREARNGKPTLFLINGLDYTTRTWSLLVAALARLDSDLGIVLYDMQGQGKTFLRDTKQNIDIRYDSQLENLKLLTESLAIPGEKYLAGLSYGGGLAIKYLAKYPADFKGYIGIAPFIEQVTNVHFDTSDHISLIMMMFDNPYKASGIYHMISGASDWNYAQVIPQLSAGKLHVVGGVKDHLVSIQSLRRFWQALPPKFRASYLELEGAGHRIPELAPDFLAAWLYKIMSATPPQGEMNLALTKTCASDLRNGN